MKCDMIMLNVYHFLDAVHLKGEMLSLSRHAIAIFEKHYEELNEEEKSMGMSFYDFQSVVSSEYPDEPPYLSAQQLFEEYDNRMRMLRCFRQEADMEPVSYTHLDVYKRQDEVMKCLPFKAGTSFEIGGQFDESAKISETEQSTCLELSLIHI